jgi:hypothetical protein
MRAATAAAEPLLDPPGVWSKFQGLRVGAGSLAANSVHAVLPRTIAPAASRRRTAVALYSGTKSSRSFDPALVLMPAV